MAILDRFVQPRHLNVVREDPLAYLEEREEAMAVHPSATPAEEPQEYVRPPLRFLERPADSPDKTVGTASARRLGQFAAPDPMGGRTSLEDPREGVTAPEEKPSFLDGVLAMEEKQLQDVAGALILFLAFLFVFVGMWVWFGFGVGLTTLGLGLFGVGFWMVWTNHRPQVVVMSEQQAKRKIKNKN